MSLLSVEPKKTNKLDFEGPLNKFIANSYDEDPSTHAEAIRALNGLRESIRQPERHASGIAALYRYYGQLGYLEKKFPIDEDQIRLTFVWYDAFRSSPLGLPTLDYEKAGVLFNVGAVHSAVAVLQKSTSSDGIKLAANGFMCAAGVFANLRDNLYVHLSHKPTPDLSTECLSALSALMLAQAQECFVEKALGDRMKAGIVAKLAHKAFELYHEARGHMDADTVRSLFPKHWRPLVEVKEHHFRALSQYQESLVAKEKDEYGEEVARLTAAAGYCAAAAKEAKRVDFAAAAELAGRVQRAHAAAKKDNDIIYHELVPNFGDLRVTTGAALAKPLPLEDLTDRAVVGEDLFARLVPFSVHQQLSSYDERKAELVRAEVARMEEATQVANSTLSSMNLPAAIDSLEQPVGLPPPLLEKSAKLREAGGIEQLKELMDTLESVSHRDMDVCNETFRMLDEEQQDDTDMKRRFADKWTRTPSPALTEKLRAEAAKYRGVLGKAMESDRIVRTKFEQNRPNIITLCKSEGELQAIIPSAAAASLSPQARTCMSALKDLLARSLAVGEARAQLEADLRELAANDDIAAAVLAAGDDGGDVDALFDQQFTRYDALRARVTSNIEEQAALLREVEQANGEFTSARSSDQTAAKRENALQNLDTAFNSYTELTNNLQEGTKFYNDLANLLLKFQSKVNDFCYARKTELKEHLKDLQHDLAAQAATPVGAMPSRGGAPPTEAERDPNFGRVEQAPPSPQPAPRQQQQQPPPQQQQQWQQQQQQQQQQRPQQQQQWSQPPQQQQWQQPPQQQQQWQQPQQQPPLQQQYYQQQPQQQYQQGGYYGGGAPPPQQQQQYGNQPSAPPTYGQPPPPGYYQQG